MLNKNRIFTLLKLSAMLLLLNTQSITAQQSYGIIEIGNGIIPKGLNNHLDVVGTQGTNNPVLWSNGTTTQLQTINNLNNNVEDINDAGEIVGSISGTSQLNDYPVVVTWNTNGNINFMDNTHDFSLGYSLNENGSFSGFSVIFGGNFNPTVWINNNPTYLILPGESVLGGAVNFAFDINNNNWAVGSISIPATGHFPFVWKSTGNIILLPDLNGSFGQAYAINDPGLIVGTVQEPITYERKAAYWENEILNIIETPAGYTNSAATDVNSSNEIVGYLQNAANSFGFIFKDGVRTDLNDLLPVNSGWSITKAVAINESGAILAEGIKNGNASSCILTPLKVLEPKLHNKWIAGEKDTISWVETGWITQNIKCILNFDTPIEQTITIEEGILLDSSFYEWEIPDTILSYQTKIVIENFADPDEKIESDIFRIKPYVLTRVTEDSTYYAYRKDRDQWGFSNTQANMWPQTWWSHFNYQGIDPFTNNLQYSQTQGDSAFGKSKSHYHPDWVTWVNTFGIDACYFAAPNGFYKAAALIKWYAGSNKWAGSCFGIAAANALAFRYKEQFQDKYPNYPDFINPITVVSDTGVKRVVNELYSHQYGNPTQANDPSALVKTPNQTLDEIRQMLLEDTAQVKTLSIYNNGGGGGHTILAYGLKQDPVQKNLYYVQVYDNSNPNSNNPITIDTLVNGGSGSWSTPDWAGWGGNGKIHLEIPSSQYLNGATFPARLIPQSAFILPQNVLEINNTPAQIIITDEAGNITGYENGFVSNEIPGSIPLSVKNGSEWPPYGYKLTTDNYSVVLSEFTEDTVSTFFFTGNKSFMYERNGATQTQTDRLFFDGGVSVANPDAQTKTVKLLNLINETTQEKLTVIRSLELVQNDSLKIENPDSNKVKLISYGSAKDYDIELNYVTENGLERFGDFGIQLSANTSHTFVPVWTELTNIELQVLVDIGNDGTIDDSLSLVNQVTGLNGDQGSLLSPNSYNLAQNYPNPFNPVTTIQYSIPDRSNVVLKVYDILGNEVGTLVNEEKDRGVYSVNFDASDLASGIYLYRLKAGSFVETRKLILLR